MAPKIKGRFLQSYRSPHKITSNSVFENSSTPREETKIDTSE